MTHLADINVGDEMYVLNSHQNNAFEANIVRVQDGIIVVEIPEKNATYTFDWETGDALDGKSILVEPDDWRVGVIQDRKEHARLHSLVIDRASDFRKDPCQRTSDEMKSAMREWTAFVNGADPVAVRTVSIQEYLDTVGRKS